MASSDSDTQRPVFWERLRGLLAREEDKENRRRLVAALVCLLISCLLWFTFTLQDVHSLTLEIPTQVENFSGDEALTSLPPKNVQAEVEGEGTDLLRLLYYERPRLPIGSGSGRVDVRGTMPNMPGSVRLKSVTPAFLELEREPRLTRTVPVRLRGEVETPATHLLMEAPQVRPDSVRISGARSLVRTIYTWPTQAVHVSGLKDSLRRRVLLADTLDGLVARSTDSVVLTADARRFTEGMRTIDVRVVGGPERSVTLDPSTIRVRYQTQVSQYQQAQDTDEFFATVSYKRVLSDTTGRVHPRIHLPDDLTIRNVEPLPSALRYYIRADK